MIRLPTLSFFVCLFMLVGLAMLSSCANIVPPTGGPRDSLPPILIKATPNDSTLRFKTNRISLDFDEYVQVDNPQDNVIIWPNPKNPPTIEAKLKTVNIRLKDSLEPNTTYTIIFGRSLKDNNEGNSDSSFNYVFSTGDHIDHNMLRGNVKLAETGKIDTTLLVVLQANLNDTAILKNPPRYYTRLNGKGNFRFFNLPSDTFNVFVVPSDYTKRYDDSTKMFAFSAKPIIVKDTATKPLALYAYQEFKEGPKRVGSGSGGSGRQQNNNTEKQNSKKKKAADTTIKVTPKLQNGKQDFQSNLRLGFSDTLMSFDSSKFRLTDTNFVSVPGFRLEKDTFANSLVVANRWTENTPYKLIIEKNAVADSSGHGLAKNDTISFVTLRESDYGSMRMRFQNLDTSKHPVLELIQGDKIEAMIPLTRFEWYQKFFLPGEYELRVLFDTNRNGKWDPGNYLEKKQPEVVATVPTRNGGNKITVRSNWDNEFNVVLPGL